MPEITDYSNGIIQVKIPMAFPLRWVNSYLLSESEGVTIVDTGPRTPINEEGWTKVFSQLGIDFGDVRQIVLTHHHEDHLGCAGWIQQQSGCSVWISERSYQEAQLMWGTDSSIKRDWPELLYRHGLPEELSLQLEASIHDYTPQVMPMPKVAFIPAGKPFVMGDREWLPIETAGHASGHLSFYHAESGILLCGDAVLPQISPSINGLVPGSDPEPVQSFLDGLLKLNRLKVSMAYPGHRNPFQHFSQRIEALRKQHEDNLTKVEQLLAAAPGSGFEVFVSIFGTRLGIHQMQFVMCETLAHIRELERRGRIAAWTGEDGVIRFRLA